VIIKDANRKSIRKPVVLAHLIRAKATIVAIHALLLAYSVAKIIIAKPAMPTADLPATKMLTFLSEVPKSGPPLAPLPFSKAELLGFREVKEWLAKGYELDSFENKLSPKNPAQVILLVVLTRSSGS
jgi:hypothetical protein